jgi:hypothetical protein
MGQTYITKIEGLRNFKLKIVYPNGEYAFLLLLLLMELNNVWTVVFQVCIS